MIRLAQYVPHSAGAAPGPARDHLSAPRVLDGVATVCRARFDLATDSQVLMAVRTADAPTITGCAWITVPSTLTRRSTVPGAEFVSAPTNHLAKIVMEAETGEQSVDAPDRANATRGAVNV